MKEHKHSDSIVRIFASDKSWIEGEALRQLNHTASLTGMKTGVGLPDLHPGKGTPVGAAFFSTDIIYPHIVGNDVGCGIGLWQTSLKANRVKRDSWARKLANLHLPWDGNISEQLRIYGNESGDSDQLLGTIGSGNHFAELQLVEKIHCKASFMALGLDNSRLFLLVHSGSRGIGEQLLRDHVIKYGAQGLVENSEDAQHYLAAHNLAVSWAGCNRALIARRFCEQLNADCRAVLDICHNSMEKTSLAGESGWLHRKGAAPSDKGPIVIPGSRGTLSYLVSPTGEQALNLRSLAHGAGRKWNRSSCRNRLRSRCSPASLTHTDLGSVVICEDKGLLFEEAPQAYKKIESVIDDMKKENLISVIATLRPLITYKKRNTI